MKLEPISSVVPASYNPRKVDPERLKLIQLSIKKLGWLLPVYATQAGELLSGHQRTHVAHDIGYSEVPVVRLEDMDSNARKAINILFNRSTNDMDRGDQSNDLKAEMLRLNPLELAAKLPDRPNYYPCLNATMEPIEPYLKINSAGWMQYALNAARSLYSCGILMPIIVRPDGRVINGIGRLQLLAERGIETAMFVHLSDEEADFAHACLNLLSMDFSIETMYADLLRYNSFRRGRNTRNALGRGFIFGLGMNELSYFDHTNDAHVSTWKKKFGQSVVDFGAGHLTETEIMRSIGVRVSAFEPYRIGIGTDSIDKDLSLTIVDAFLRDVASGVRYSTVFLSAVLNSVPFIDDRRKIIQILSALCSQNTTVYAVSPGIDDQTANMSANSLNHRDAGVMAFKLSYEPGIVIGDFKAKPKMQKFHRPEELYELFKTGFNSVKICSAGATEIGIIARDPITDRSQLRAALEFEFNLPYPDGSRMERAEQAVAAFTKRLGVKL